MTTRVGLRRRNKNNYGLVGMGMLALALLVSAFMISRRPATVQAVESKPTIVAEFDTIMVPVPEQLVTAGTKLKDVRFKLVAYPKSQLPLNALVSTEGFLEAAALAPLPANLPLFKDNLSLNAHSANPVIERIPPGMRAITMNVDATAAVEGWAGSGAKIDVLLVQNDRTTVVAENVRILSAERSVSPVEGQGLPNVPKTVTLLVTQEQALAVTTAIPMGKIAFALRGTVDDEKWRDTVFTADRLKAGRILKVEKNVITGYASVSNDGEKKGYAFVNDKWIRSESVPEGILLGQNQK